MTPATIAQWLATNNTVAYDYYEYNLQNRLSLIEKYNTSQVLTETVEYKYNLQGIRTQKIEDFGSDPIVTDYLINPYNHTGYAQVLQETTDTCTIIGLTQSIRVG